MRVCFLDIEASGLGAGGYPIELGWVFEDGASDAVLIAPPPAWGADGWDPVAETVHGLTRAQLLADGEAAAVAADRASAALAGCLVLSDAPLADNGWLHTLLALGSASPAVHIQDFEQALFERMTRRLGVGPEMAPDAIMDAVERMRRIYLDAVAEAEKSCPYAHRALADARRLHAIWTLALAAAIP